MIKCMHTKEEWSDFSLSSSLGSLGCFYLSISYLRMIKLEEKCSLFICHHHVDLGSFYLSISHLILNSSTTDELEFKPTTILPDSLWTVNYLPSSLYVTSLRSSNNWEPPKQLTNNMRIATLIWYEYFTKLELLAQWRPLRRGKQTLECHSGFTLYQR